MSSGWPAGCLLPGLLGRGLLLVGRCLGRWAGCCWAARLAQLPTLASLHHAPARRCGGSACPDPSAVQSGGGTCGDSSWPGMCCMAGFSCVRGDSYYWQCKPNDMPAPGPTCKSTDRVLKWCAAGCCCFCCCFCCWGC
jgi:hypothetical protein